MKLACVAAAALALGCTGMAATHQSVPNPPQPVAVKIDASRTARPVSKYIYGMFIENLGSLVYRSLWSEMLDDRKFYAPITDKTPEAESASRSFRGMQPRRWQPVGPGASVTMDANHPFVGEHSPRIQLDGATPRGIQQTGLTLVKGKRYTGHIYLRGTPGSRVKVTLSWGPEANGRETIDVGALPSAYKKVSLQFTAQADTSNGALEITGTGTGDFHVGTVSLMPADNVDGFRPDTIALLRQLHSGFWRLPGGNFISDFSWYDSVGNRDQRPPVVDYAWNAVQSNDVGMDEFMTFCRLIGVEPYITVNAGFGDAHSAAQEVQYMNGAATTPMGAWRARNGHPAPYHVKYWDIGNEPYGTWQLGRTDLKYYVLKHNIFARAMRKADPSITLLASGAMPDEMTIEGITRAMHLDNLQAQFGGPADWTGGLLAHSWGYFDGITEHWYQRAGYHFDASKANDAPVKPHVEAGYVPEDQTLLEWVRHPSNRVHLKAEEWQEYERRFPEMVKKGIFLSNDEYAYSGGPTNLKLALAYGMVLNEMMRHTDFWRMSAFTMGVSTLDYTPTAAVFNTNGLLFKLYRDHLGTIPVELTGNSPQPAPKYPPGGDQPKTSAGSPTYPLDMIAELTPDHKFLTLAVVNATETPQRFELNVTGMQLAGDAVDWQMTGASPDAADHVGQKPQVAVKKVDLGPVPHEVTVAPISVNVYRFPVAQ